MKYESLLREATESSSRLDQELVKQSQQKSERDDLLGEIRCLKEEIATMGHLNSEYAELNGVLSETRRQLEEFRTQVVTQQQEILSKDSTVNEMHSKIEEITTTFQEHITSSENELAVTKQALSDALSAVVKLEEADLASQVDHLTQSLAVVNQQLAQEKQDTEALAEKLKRVKILLAKTKNALSEKEQEISTMLQVGYQ